MDLFCSNCQKQKSIEHQLLFELIKNDGSFVSLQDLAFRLKISLFQIKKIIIFLQSAGYPLEIDKENVAFATDIPALIDYDAPFYYLSETTSTQDVCKMLNQAGSSEFTVVLAENQTAGRGRNGKVWQSSAGKGLYFTILLKPSCPIDKLSALPLCIGVAIRRAILTITGLKLGLKWPNDLIIGFDDKKNIDIRKIAGILMESKVENGLVTAVFLGIGLNVKQNEFINLEKAISLEDLNIKTSRKELLVEILKHIRTIYAKFTTGQTEELLDEWRENNICINQTVYIMQNNRKKLIGSAKDIDESGALLLEIDGKIQKILAGEVSLSLLEAGC